MSRAFSSVKCLLLLSGNADKKVHLRQTHRNAYMCWALFKVLRYRINKTNKVMYLMELTFWWRKKIKNVMMKIRTMKKLEQG